MKIADQNDVPVGKSKDFTYKGDPALLVNVKGSLRAYVNICTHQDCQTEFDGNAELHCPCHGSVYNAETGAVLNPPAMEPLPKIDIKLEGETIETVE